MVMRVRAPRVAACAIALLFGAAPRAAASDAVLYRVFLRDGSALVSYGEFARVADRVVMSVPIGDGATPSLQLVSIAESAVDWDRTDRYAETARAQRYAETRGESDFTLLSNEVARVLNEVALTSDPARRLALATEARRVLASWPSQHYGYRAADVAQLSGWLDEVVSELRVAAGQSRFDLSFAATTAPPPREPLLPAPTLRESIELAFSAARLTPAPSERLSLLRAVEAALAPLASPEDGDGSAATWATAMRVRAAAEMATELRIGKAYSDLAAGVLQVAEQRARRADVRGVENLIKKVRAEDAKLGRARPQEAAALLASLDAKLDATRRLRLARDAWNMRVGALREYRRRANFAFGQLERAKKPLADIRQLAGPSPKTLNRLTDRVAAGRRDLSLIKPPTELETAHGLALSALHMASRAADARRTAIASGDLKTAWDASSAAAGALMLFDQALQELDRLMAVPELR
jgi:hypothetical protein